MNNFKKPAYEIAEWDRTSSKGTQYRTGTFTINEMEINGVLFKDIRFPIVLFYNEKSKGTQQPTWRGQPPKDREDNGPKTAPIAAEAHAAAIRKSVEAIATPNKPVEYVPLKVNGNSQKDSFWDEDSIPF